MSIALALSIAAQLSLGGVVLKPADYLDGRAIASGTGTPVVMLTLSPLALKRLKRVSLNAVTTLDGKPVVARREANIVEFDGQPDFQAAAALAKAITGKPPLPDSLDE